MQKYKKFLDLQAEKGQKHKIIAKYLEVIKILLIFLRKRSGKAERHPEKVHLIVSTFILHYKRN